MKSKLISLLLSTFLAVSVISGCSNNTANDSKETSANKEQASNNTSATTSDTSSQNNDSTNSTDTSNVSSPKNFDELIASLHAGQSYSYAPICEGEKALLVTSYAFDDLNGHQATYEASIYIEKDGSTQKVTTVQSGGTAYPIALTKDNCLILNMRNSIQKAYVDKSSGKLVTAEDSHVNYQDAEDGSYHNYKKDAAELPTDSTLFDDLSKQYESSEVISFTSAGISSDGLLKLEGAVYASYVGENLYNINTFLAFDSASSGHTLTRDGVSSIPFTYELTAKDITFHFGSADDTTKGTIDCSIPSYPKITLSGDNIFKSDSVSISCVEGADPKTFDAVKYYDNDSELLMKVKTFNKTTLSGDLYRAEKIKKDNIENAKVGDSFYSVNGTQFTAISFEDVNKEINYATDKEFKSDVLGTTRYDKFLVKCSDDNFYYALEKEDYEEEYKVVAMFTEENLRKLIEENVSFTIKDSCEIILLKAVANDASTEIKEEYTVGREFKGDNYPGWSDGAKEYFMTSDMLVSIGVIDKEIYNIVQVYVP